MPETALNILKSLLHWFVLASPYVLGLVAAAQLWRLVRLVRELCGAESPRRNYADILGYRLEVCWQWFELTASQRAGMANGVGAASWSPELRRAIDDLTQYKGPSVPHDVGYNVKRTWDGQLLEDCRFFRNCLRVVIQDEGGLFQMCLHMLWPASCWRIVKRVLLARTLYRALRAGGSKAFDAADKVKFAVDLGDASGTLIVNKAGAAGYMHSVDMSVLEDANDLCRSAMQITDRHGLDTDWGAFRLQLRGSLERQQAAMHPGGTAT